MAQLGMLIEIHGTLPAFRQVTGYASPFFPGHSVVEKL
jgi:hypothetical protein